MRTWGPFSFYNRYIAQNGLPPVVKDSYGRVSAAHRQPASSGGVLGLLGAMETPLLVSFLKWSKSSEN